MHLRKQRWMIQNLMKIWNMKEAWGYGGWNIYSALNIFLSQYAHVQIYTLFAKITPHASVHLRKPKEN